MHILIISDAYPPMRTSCATQIYDLAQAFIEQGHQVSIVIPAHAQRKSVEISNADGPTVYRVRCFKTKDVGYARRTIAEFINPFIIGFHLKRNPNFIEQKIDGITWYSPTIFWGPLVKQLKELFKCKAYLILRDIFPDWAVDIGVIRNKHILRFFKFVAEYQYNIANIIGVQSPNNIEYFKKSYPSVVNKIEVLWNWIGSPRQATCSIRVDETILAGKFIFIYTGNLGVAQGVVQFLSLIKQFQGRNDVGFIFVGRGSQKWRLKEGLNKISFQNVIFYDEINQDQLPDLYKQCHAGLISLDFRHATHNIPGKLISYLYFGLPVVGFVNSGNDLIKLVNDNGIGVLFSENSNIQREQFWELETWKDEKMRRRCKNLATKFFSAKSAAKQMMDALNHSRKS